LPDPSPWKERLSRYIPLLRVMAWSLHTDRRLMRRFDGSDVVGETMQRALASLDQFRGQTEAEFIRWLQEILHTAFLDLVRRGWAGRRTVAMEASLAAVCSESSARWDRFLVARDPSPSAQLEGQEVMLRFATAVEQLPRDQRDVVLLRDLHELPVKQIAELVGRTEKAVAGLLLRGRMKLRESFPDYREGG
jgi:RNA polymerase sigma-70 factor (ECF subfamily)